MSNGDTVYRNLQIRINEETVGFPATASGSDIRLLKSCFSPDQAEMATQLSHRYETLEEVLKRSEGTVASTEKAERILIESARGGMIGLREQDGKKQYRLIPLIVGFGEAGSHNPTPEFSEAMGAYFSESTFWQDFVNSPVPQMRTIPVEQSITPEHHVGSYDEVKHIIETTTGPISVLPCVCREGAQRRGDPCKITSRTHTCMAFREGAANLIEGGAKEIGKAEALEILRKNGEEGMILQPSNTRGPDFICSCCGCCCGILQLHKGIQNPVEHWATNFFASVDRELCTSCGTCEESCQVNAISLDDGDDMPVVDLTRCLGCGNCAKDCPAEAIQLQKKEAETLPPNDTEELFEAIVAQK
jgi:electron transport complex protein RnfB